MAALTATTSTAHGTVLPTAAAVSSSDTFPNPNGRAIVIVTNGSASPITVTFVTSGVHYVTTSVSYPIADDAITVTNGTRKVIGPFDKTVLNDIATGLITMTFSATTGVTADVIEIGQA